MLFPETGRPSSVTAALVAGLVSSGLEVIVADRRKFMHTFPLRFSPLGAYPCYFVDLQRPYCFWSDVVCECKVWGGSRCQALVILTQTEYLQTSCTS